MTNAFHQSKVQQLHWRFRRI